MDFTWGWDNGRALIGIVVIYLIALALSERKRAFPWRIVLGATVLQFAFALLLFGVPPVRNGLYSANVVVDALEEATRQGTGFVFGYVGDNVKASDLMSGDAPPLFFFQILPIVIVVAALSAMLWHWGILKWVTKGFAFIFARTMGLGGATSLAVSANVFMGMTEAPVLVRPYLSGMTRSELFVLMTAGFATIAGSVLIIYVNFLEPVMSPLGLDPLAQLLTASIMAAPAAVAVALAIVPETAKLSERAHEPDFSYQSTMDAFATGAADGLKIVLNIATMLIAALAILWLGNALLGAIPMPEGWGSLSIQRVLGYVFAPLMYMIGVPWEDAQQAGSLMGVKTVLTEFVAFIDLAAIPADQMDPRTRVITAHAICGFANFGSIGILIGGLSIIAPERRDVFLALAWKTLIAGTLATCLSGAVVGALPFELFVKTG
jgi:CNT family concentrative nucleoside transporter